MVFAQNDQFAALCQAMQVVRVALQEQRVAYLQGNLGDLAELKVAVLGDRQTVHAGLVAEVG